MEPPKSHNYYFPGVQDVECVSVSDDEFEGTQFDDVFLGKFSSLAPEWRDAVLRAQDYGKVVLTQSEASVEVMVTKRNSIRHPAEGQWQHDSEFWHESAATARRRGWDWPANTVVRVRLVRARDVADLLLSYILHYSFEWQSPRRIPVNESPTVATVSSWKAFWEMALGSLAHDLPKWPGAPSAVVILHRAGNDCVVAAERERGTYCVVTHTTS